MMWGCKLGLYPMRTPGHVPRSQARASGRAAQEEPEVEPISDKIRIFSDY